MNKNILIVSYYWPPAGGPGVQRWLKFTKYLPEFGYQPIVYIPKNPSYPIIDKSLEIEINAQVQVIKHPIWEPYSIAEKLTKKNKNFKAGQFESEKKQSFLSRLSIFIRGNFFIPDARKFWINPSVNFLKKYIKGKNIDTLITTGPPHSLHLIGLKLKVNNPSIKWIADFRDPWTQISYHSQLTLTSYADKKHKKLEHEVMKFADIVLSTSYTDKENFEKLGAKNVVCITNGFDSEVTPGSNKTKKFTISYVGAMESLRNPKNLWLVINELISEYPGFKENFTLKLTGKIGDSILSDLNNTPLKDVIINTGYLSHNDSILEINNSNLLLITSFPEEKSKGIIPGKLFEYLASNKIILSIGPKQSDVERILNQTQTGEHFTFEDVTNLKSFIIDEYCKWQNNSFSPISANINQFHRKELTKELVKVIESLH